VIGEERIEGILKASGKSLDERCCDLVSAANTAGSPDNVTVMLIRRAS
jgi:serine/threonine protein phosphatase PrpC